MIVVTQYGFEYALESRISTQVAACMLGKQNSVQKFASLRTGVLHVASIIEL